MAEPKKKLSKRRTGQRRANYSVADVAVTVCSQCGETIRPHIVCPFCGYYKNVAVKKTLAPKRILADQETK